MISTEYVAQAIDPKNKLVRYVSAGSKSEADLLKWFSAHSLKGTFAGLECHIQKRYLINGKPFQLQQKHGLWLLIGAQFLFIVWKLSQ